MSYIPPKYIKSSGPDLQHDGTDLDPIPLINFTDGFTINHEPQYPRYTLSVNNQFLQHQFASGALNSILTTKTGSVNSDLIVTTGRTSTNDGGGGVFYWVTGSSATADEALVYGNTVYGRWFRRIDNGSYNVKWFGAKGDGITDDTSYINAAYQTAYTRNCSLYLPAGTYYLNSVNSSDPDSYVSILVAKDNVFVYGDGETLTILKVGTTVKNTLGVGTGPMVIGKQGVLRNASFRDFKIDWSPNVLTISDSARNFAGIFALQGGQNILIQNITFNENPGNQCVFFPATTENSQSNIVVRDCKFLNNGAAVPGNYNFDHSSVYCQGKNNKYINNRFIANTISEQNGLKSIINGAAFEIHGTGGEATDNFISGYELGFWLATDFESMTDVTIKGNTIYSYIGYSWGNATQACGTYNIINNNFNMLNHLEYSGSTTAPIVQFFCGAPDNVVDQIRFEGNVVSGVQDLSGAFALQINYTKNMIIKNNTFNNFSLRAISAGGTDLGDGYAHHTLSIQNNIFNNCVETLYTGSHAGVINCQAPTKKIKSLLIQNNSFESSSSLAISPLNLNIQVDKGIISDNNISTRLTSNWAISNNTTGAYIDNAYPSTPGAIFGAPGSRWVNTLTGHTYVYSASLWS